MGKNTVLNRIYLYDEGLPERSNAMSIMDAIDIGALFIRRTWCRSETFYKITKAEVGISYHGWPTPDLQTIRKHLDEDYVNLQTLKAQKFPLYQYTQVTLGQADWQSNEKLRSYVSEVIRVLSEEIEYRMEKNRELCDWIDWICYEYETLKAPCSFHFPVHPMPKELLPRINDKRAGYVYVVKQIGGDYYKIGRTKDPEQRKRIFKVKLPFDIEVDVLIQTPDCFALEKKLHQQFKHKRVGGEWFALTDQDLSEIKSIAM